MRIDIHTHAYPDDFADKGMKATEQYLGLKSAWPMTIAGILKQMEVSGIDKCVLLCFVNKVAELKEKNDWAIGLHNDKIIPFGTLHPEYKDCIAEVIRLKKEGLRGIKFHCGANRYYPDDERLFPVYEEMGDNMIALFHAGAFRFMADDPIHGAPRRIATIRKMFPRLKIIAAHFGGYLMLDQSKEHLVGKDLYLDTTWPPSMRTIGDPNEIVKIVEKHGADKILFGTEFPFTNQKDEIDYIIKMPLTSDQKEKILGKNAKQLLNL